MTEVNLKPADLDRLGQALLTLTKELWVVKDRVKVLEAALAEAGVIPPDAADSFQPDNTLSEALTAERIQLINSVLGSLEGNGSD